MKILNTEPHRYSSACSEKLNALGAVLNFSGTRKELKEAIVEAEVLLIGLKFHIDSEVLENAHKLQLIVTPTTGLNHIDQKKASEMGIEILSLKGEVNFLRTVTATAELSWSLLLSVVRRINAANLSVNSGNWERDLFIGNELKGKTIGIFGYGRLGQMVASYGHAFGMKVYAFDPYIKIHGDDKTTQVSRDKLLRESDIISIHIPLNEETRGLFSAQIFSKMKDGVVLINTSRGEIIDEIALLKCLKNGKVSKAGLDVLSSEYGTEKDWLFRDRLIDYARQNDNLIITPHIGGATTESVEAANNFIIDKLASKIIS